MGICSHSLPTAPHSLLAPLGRRVTHASRGSPQPCAPAWAIALFWPASPIQHPHDIFTPLSFLCHHRFGVGCHGVPTLPPDVRPAGSPDLTGVYAEVMLRTAPLDQHHVELGFDRLGLLPHFPLDRFIT